MRRRAIGIAMLQRVAGAVDAGTLAVPEAEHALNLAPRIGLDLLRAEDCGRCEVFVDGRQEFDPALFQEFFRAPELEIDAAERRAAIARDEACGVQSVGAVAIALLEQD